MSADSQFYQGEIDKLLRGRKALRQAVKDANERADAERSRADKQLFDLGVLLGCLRRMADGIPPLEAELLTLNPIAIHTILQLGVNAGLMHEAYVRRIREIMRERDNART